MDGKDLVIIQPVTTSQAFAHHMQYWKTARAMRNEASQCLWLTRYPIVHIQYSNNSQHSSINKCVASTWPAVPCVRNVNIPSYSLSLTSHREEGSDHAIANDVLQLSNSAVRPIRHTLSMLWCNCYSMTTVAIYEERRSHLTQQVSAMATSHWLLSDQTLPLCKGRGLRCGTCRLTKNTLGHLVMPFICYSFQ